MLPNRLPQGGFFYGFGILARRQNSQPMAYGCYVNGKSVGVATPRVGGCPKKSKDSLRYGGLGIIGKGWQRFPVCEQGRVCR